MQPSAGLWSIGKHWYRKTWKMVLRWLSWVVLTMQNWGRRSRPLAEVEWPAQPEPLGSSLREHCFTDPEHSFQVIPG